VVVPDVSPGIAAGEQMARVTVECLGASVELNAATPRVVIGRDSSCDLVVTDPSVSRRHAEIALEAGQLVVRDLGSSNGTWVNGTAAGRNVVAIEPDSAVFVGVVPVDVVWVEGARIGATRYEPNMAALIQRSIDAARAQAAARAATPSAAPAAPAATAGLTAQQAPDAGQFPYRVQGHNDNGVLLIALRREAFTNNDVLDGVVEFTATDNETVNAITVELVELHSKGKRDGHVWDRMIVRQGPWNAANGDVVLLPFQLRVPAGTSASGRDVAWEVRGYVDIAWAYDVETHATIQMRNTDIEAIRDSLGALDYRVSALVAAPLGQKYTGSFQPSPTRIKELGITDIHFEVEYLGVNLKLTLTVEKSSLFRFDKSESLTIELAQLRTMPRDVLTRHLHETIERLMGRG
jgi:hypothetical protein